MFTLITDRSRYFKVKRIQSADEVEAEFGTPVTGDCFSGRIIKLRKEKLKKVTAAVGDTYATLAKKYGIGEAELRELNYSKPVYPTCKIFVPEKRPKQ